MLPLAREMVSTCQLLVPVAMPDWPSSVSHETLATPTLSSDTPAIAMELALVVKVGTSVGDVIDIEGGTVSFC